MQYPLDAGAKNRTTNAYNTALQTSSRRVNEVLTFFSYCDIGLELFAPKGDLSYAI